MNEFILSTHHEWHQILNECLKTVDVFYMDELRNSNTIIPDLSKIFAAFSQPLKSTEYILLGESPYPRANSANGYAFWDAEVDSLWSKTGLSKQVNRATSLRNWLKMLLLARGDLNNDLSQAAIAKINKSMLVNTAEEFFKGIMQRKFLLLNASLIYSEGRVNYHAKHWRPFIDKFLSILADNYGGIKLVLFGKIADKVCKSGLTIGLQCEHPYNLSFITNPDVVEFFKPMDLLIKQ